MDGWKDGQIDEQTDIYFLSSILTISFLSLEFFSHFRAFLKESGKNGRRGQEKHLEVDLQLRQRSEEDEHLLLKQVSSPSASPHWPR